MRERSARAQMPMRLLRLLSLLQTRREWSGAELAQRLGVTTRTVRRDVDRLRTLDYPVDATTGTAGGYRLASGRNLPPLQLDDEEAVAVATGLVTATSAGVSGIEESAMRALAKLEQVLPARLRPKLAALGAVTASVGRPDVPRVDPATLAVLASACRDHELLTFDYRSRDAEPAARRVEPHHLVSLRGHWYLLAYDPERADWRTFRLDRLANPAHTHRHFTPRELPEQDAATFVSKSFARARYRYWATVTVELPADTLRASLFSPIPWEIEDIAAQRCVVRLSADDPRLVVQYVAAIAATAAEFTVDAHEEITTLVRDLGSRLAPDRQTMRS